MTRDISRTFQQIDVFGSAPFAGNPVAVVVDGEGLTTTQMATVSAWTNLSECTFLLPPTTAEADYRVRIFSLSNELPFAGHPTLGSARAWLAAGGQPRNDDVVVQECAAGLVPVRYDGEELAFAAPALVRTGEVSPEFLRYVISMLGVEDDDVVDAAWVDNGPGWVGVLLRSADKVLSVEPKPTDVALPEFASPYRPHVGVVGFHGDGHECAYEVRAFFADNSGGIREDPVTGSLNASVAQWMIDSGRVSAPYTASQGTRLDRSGRINVNVADGELWIGGRTTIAIRGHIDIPS
ncbi:PhzF family phenazine biosynthesis protein [Natronoglycomyces albus]|uniref:PhzF family phenazine biosynthesis protein n=1 Tax=Natronoglycomyces albus TaxID=2811108 RepID=A0A895XK39_9ACTN|nr:PhzF family phenazine biosynthesis protein [Natronoglycomyces albus]QSB04182.1 PhzF family phenazine biosynthesis protein [Natronoglycomyces albus]